MSSKYKKNIVRMFQFSLQYSIIQHVKQSQPNFYEIDSVILLACLFFIVTYEQNWILWMFMTHHVLLLVFFRITVFEESLLQFLRLAWWFEKKWYSESLCGFHKDILLSLIWISPFKISLHSHQIKV